MARAEALSERTRVEGEGVLKEEADGEESMSLLDLS